MDIERLTVIPIDKTVILNGVSFNGLNFDCDESIHAFHFKDGVSTVEYVNGKGSEIVDGFDLVQNAIEAWIAKQEEIQALQQQAATLALEKEEVQPVTAFTLEQKITAILKQFNQDRLNGKDLIQELDTIVRNERIIT